MQCDMNFFYIILVAFSYRVLPLFSLVGPIFVGPKYKKKPNSVYIFVFTTNQIYSTWN